MIRYSFGLGDVLVVVFENCGNKQVERQWERDLAWKVAESVGSGTSISQRLAVAERLSCSIQASWIYCGLSAAARTFVSYKGIASLSVPDFSPRQREPTNYVNEEVCCRPKRLSARVCVWVYVLYPSPHPFPDSYRRFGRLKKTRTCARVN